MSRSNSIHTLNRVIFGLALVGVLVVVHLGIQQSRGFDRGCLGFTVPAGVEATFDCGVVVQSSAGYLLGVSNVVWGLLFYLAIVGLSAAVLLTSGARHRLVDRIRAGALAVGVLYSAYMVYLQVAVIRELCALCMISAGIVLLLTALQAVKMFGLRQSGAAVSRDPSPMKEYRFMGVTAAVIAVLIIVDVAYFSSIEPARAATADATVTTPGAPAAAHQHLEATCGFDDAGPQIQNYEAILGVTDPFAGNPDASVTFIEFFDPNCPHCKTQHAVTKQLVDEFGDRVRFFFKPVPLWQFSVAQIEALYAAAQEGKFDEMLGGQFDRQRQGGLAMADLRSIASEIGMDADRLEQRIERGLYRETTMQQREIAAQIGLRGVPAVFIDGRMVEGRSRTHACLQELLENATES